jgi:NADH-ubiquinone oxidoreductase chain 1
MKIIEILSLIIPLLVSIAYLTLAERKIMGSMQRRLGPNKIGLLGVLQP